MRVHLPTRRAFLQGAGLFALSIPFLSSLSGRAIAAPVAPKIRKMLVIFTPFGQVAERWFPAESARAMQPLSDSASAMALTDIAGDVSPVFQRATYETLLPKMLFLDGIDAIYSTGHERSYPLTGYRVELDAGQTLEHESIDQIIAEKSAIYGSEPAFRSIHLACGMLDGSTNGASISYKRQANGIINIPHTVDPAAVWDVAFKDIAPGPAGQQAFEQLKAQRVGLIDRVHEDYARVRTNPRLSKADAQNLDQYMQYLRELEQSVSGMSAVDCTPPPRPDTTTYPEGKHRIQEALCADQAKNVVHLLRCGLSNIVTLNLEARSLRYHELGVEGDHHGLSHSKDSPTNDAARDYLEKIARFHAEVVASIAKELDSAVDPETGRTLLDDTLIVWTSDMGSVYNHKGARLPVVMLGGTGAIRQNALVDFRSPYTWTYGGQPAERIGISYNNVLIALCQLFGLEPADYEQNQLGIGDYGVVSYFANRFPSKAAYEKYAFGDRRSVRSELLA